MIDTYDIPKSNLSQEDISELREKAKSDLYFFAKGILGFDWLVPQIHMPLCQILEDYANWEEFKNRVKVTLPRGWLKTTVCSCSYPIWRAINNPNVRILLTQNTYSNATAKLRRIKSMFEGNQLFKALFPEILPDSSCTWKSDSLCVKRDRGYDESTFEAAGVGTQVTSRHYDLIIEDDTVAPEDDDVDSQVACPSRGDIEKAIGWHKLAIPLLNNPAKDQILVVGTRWAEDDLLEYIEKEEGDITTSYSREARENNVCVYPERFDERTLNVIERGLGPYMFAALYMNQPLRAANMIFDRRSIMFYETEPRDLAVYTTMDLACDPENVKKPEPDFSVVMTCGKSLITGRVYVLDYWRKRANPGEVIDALFSHYNKWHPLKVGVEAVAYQSTLQYWIKERQALENLFFEVIGITHGKRSKNERILGLQPPIFAGTLHIRSWMTELVNELLAFPLGAYDDIIDALSMQIEFWNAIQVSSDTYDAPFDEDPFSLQGAINSIQKRKERPKGFPWDVLSTERVA